VKLNISGFFWISAALYECRKTEGKTAASATGAS